MKKELLFEIPELDCAIVFLPDNDYTPWVAAWAYDRETSSWGQEHYFSSFVDLYEYLKELAKGKKKVRVLSYLNAKVEECIIKGMIK